MVGGQRIKHGFDFRIELIQWNGLGKSVVIPLVGELRGAELLVIID